MKVKDIIDDYKEVAESLDSTDNRVLKSKGVKELLKLLHDKTTDMIEDSFATADFWDELDPGTRDIYDDEHAYLRLQYKFVKLLIKNISTDF